MSESKRLSFGGRPLPLDIGSIVDGEAMGLALAPIQFDFAWRGVRVACRCEHGPGGAWVKLVGDAGPLPFSAESPEARAAVQAMIDHANSTFAGGGGGPAFRVAQGRILLGSERPLPMPVNAVALVTAIATFLAPAEPYLGLLAEVVRPPLHPCKPGESALQPGWRRHPVRGRAR